MGEYRDGDAARSLRLSGQIRYVGSRGVICTTTKKVVGYGIDVIRAHEDQIRCTIGEEAEVVVSFNSVSLSRCVANGRVGRPVGRRYKVCSEVRR